MSFLVLDEIRETFALVQQDTTRQRVRLKAIRLHLIGYNNPAGSIRLQIKRGANILTQSIQTTADIKSNIDEILGTTDLYWHGMVKFDLDDILFFDQGTIWTMEVMGVSGYNFNDSAYIGWVKPHEDFKNTRATMISASPFENPFGYELWGYKGRI